MSISYDECQTKRPARPTPANPSHVMQQFSLAGQHCVITGGSRGIGFAVAESFAEAGANVVLIYSSARPDIEDKARELADRCGVRVTSYRCDVSKALEVEAMVEYLKQTLGRIHVFVANAGISNPKSIFDETLDEYHAQVDVNVHGVYYCAKHVGLVFREQGYGNFIITSSINARIVAIPVDHTTYNMTKAAVSHLGRSLAREWRDFACVNMVCPGWIETDMSNDQPSVNEAHRMAVLGRQGTVNELKAIYLYLASSASSFVTGAEFTVDGGYTLP